MAECIFIYVFLYQAITKLIGGPDTEKWIGGAKFLLLNEVSFSEYSIETIRL